MFDDARLADATVGRASQPLPTFPHADALTLWLERCDRKGEGVACGGGFISPRKKCSRDKAKTTSKEALAKTKANAKAKHALKKQVAEDKGKKATPIQEKPKPVPEKSKATRSKPDAVTGKKLKPDEVEEFLTKSSPTDKNYYELDALGYAPRGSSRGYKTKAQAASAGKMFAVNRGEIDSDRLVIGKAGKDFLLYEKTNPPIDMERVKKRTAEQIQSEEKDVNRKLQDVSRQVDDLFRERKNVPKELNSEYGRLSNESSYLNRELKQRVRMSQKKDSTRHADGCQTSFFAAKPTRSLAFTKRRSR